MDGKLISVILPVFNAEKYLKRCVESILSQTYPRFELIMVDDGSTDGSSEICDAYGRRHPFIRVVHSENLGVGNARNIGLELCKGEYITFVDADDFVHPRYLELMMGAMGNNRLVCCGTFDLEAEETILMKDVKDINKQDIVLDGRYDFSGSYAHMTCWGALYDRGICKGLRFDTDLYVAEDTLFYHRALQRAEGLTFISEKLYYYVHYSESAAHGNYDSKRFTEAEAWQRIVELFRDYPRELKEGCQIACSCRGVALLRRMIADERYDKKEYEFLMKQIRAGVIPVLKSKQPLYQKLSFILWRLCPRLNLFIKKRWHVIRRMA